MPTIIISQSSSPPNQDRSWDVDNMHINDEFTFLDSDLWVINPNSVGQEIYQSNLIQIDQSGTGTLNLIMRKVQLPDGTFKYFSGGVTTGDHTNQKGFNNPFGYYEIRCKTPKGKGLWPAFWLYSRDPYDCNCIDPLTGQMERRVEEIDILENPDMGNPNSNPEWNTDNYLGYNWHNSNENCEIYSKSSEVVGQAAMPHEILIPNSNTTDSYHTYALEWLPGVLIFYFDDTPVAHSFYNSNIPKCNRKEIIITNQVQHNGNIYSPDSEGKITPNESIFSIDYLRVYRLKFDGININSRIYNQSDLDLFDFNLKKSITINPTSNIVLPVNSKITLRATDKITIQKNFLIPLGSEFRAIVHKAPPIQLGPAY